MANGTTNGRAHVLEISNRAAVQSLVISDETGIIGTLNNHMSGLNPNAHGVANIGGLQGYLDGKSPVGHGHAISDVTSLQSTLDGKEPAFSKNTGFNKNFGTTAGTVTQGNDSRLSDARTPTAHSHAIADVTGLSTTLAGKSDTGHTHSISNVTGLQTALDGKQATISGATGSITYVKAVNFAGQTVTTGTINVSNGIITSIS